MNADILLRECDCAIITSPASLYYLSGFDQSDALIVITRSDCVYLTNPLYEVAVKDRLREGFRLMVCGRSQIDAFLRDQIASSRRVGVEYGDMCLERYHALFDRTDAETVDLSPILASMRKVKAPEEIALIEHAESIVDRSFAEILPLLREGVSEREIRDELVFRLMRNGAEGTAFDTIVAFGENAAMPHAVPSERALKKGDCVLMDFGAKYAGYCSDFTRTVCFGAPTVAFREAYDIVLRSHLAALTYIQSGGRICAEADRIARDIVDSSSFKGLFTHTLGHGVGIEIHESPSLGKQSKDLLEDGSVFTVEPGIYVEGEFGIRIESLAKIENCKLTVIDRSDKEIYLV